MSLREYKRKRDFKATPEPAGGKLRRRAGRSFVIQKHAASRLHYDFRLELDGTLKSWAIPKGPSLDPAVKSLAVQVEDHPLDYADFEGVIPKGEYGGGTVMVWDHGAWEPEGDPNRDFRSGKLKFRLLGEKLRGSWALVRMGGRAGEDGRNWLLIKHNDDEARPLKKYDVLKKEPLSILSGRDLDEIASDADRVWRSNRNGAAKEKTAKSKPAARRSAKGSNKAPTKKKALKKNGPAVAVLKPADVAAIAGAKRAAQPADFKPQLATLADAAPTGEGWFHELKFDGYRMVALVKNGRVRLVTRNGNDWTKRFTYVADAVAAIGVKQAILDGEIVSLNDEGVSDFQQLQNSLSSGNDASLVYYVFDLPHCLGYDLTRSPLSERKKVLARIVLTHEPANDGIVRYSDHVQGEGGVVIEQACQRGLEGIICKRADSPYEQARAKTWLKVKCTKRQEFVIGGFTKPKGSRTGFGSLLLGYYQDGRLTYAGHVGAGFTEQSLRELAKQLKATAVDRSPFEGRMPTAHARNATWVRPTLVAEVAFSEWTSDGQLRHPSFQGLREDKKPKQITREEAAPMPRASKTSPSKASGQKNGKPRKLVAPPAHSGKSSKGDATVAGVRITNADRVLYPEQGLTKLDLARYYEAVAELILPHLAGRPLTLVRCPEGRASACFYQKHLTSTMPDGLRGVMIKEKTKAEEYIVVDDLAGLVSLVQMGVLEIHPWPAREDKIENPDLLVFDFDPGEDVAWKAVIDAARECRDRLAEIGLKTFLRTTGGKGLHVVAPLTRRNSWDQLKSFAKAVADDMVRRSPDRYVANMSKAKRRGKIFVDYLRNQRGATAIASFSTRARAGAPVAVPLSWDELTARLKPNQFTVANLHKRLSNLKADPWDDFFDLRQSITRDMEQALGVG